MKRALENSNNHESVVDDSDMSDTMELSNMLKKHANDQTVSTSFNQGAFNEMLVKSMANLSKSVCNLSNNFNVFQQKYVQNNYTTNTTVVLAREDEQSPLVKPTQIFILNREDKIASKEALEDQLKNDSSLNAVKFNGVVSAKGNKILIIELDGDDQIEAVQAHLTAKGLDHQLTNPDAKVDKRFVLSGFRSSITEDALIGNILAKESGRPQLNQQSLSVLKYHNKHNSCYAILGYMNDAAQLMNDPKQQYHHVGARKIDIFPYTEVSICDRCSNFHSTRLCKSSEIRCNRCAGEHQFNNNCSASPKCANCTRAKIEKTNHTAFFIACPARKSKMVQLIQTKGY